MSHPFRAPTSRPPSTRSTETPMDFVYERPPTSGEHLSGPSAPAIRPLKVIDAAGNVQPPRPPPDASRPAPLKSASSRWFGSSALSPEPPRKRPHYEAESMDWECCPPAPPMPTPPLFPDAQTTRAPGGTFLFQLPAGLPAPPVASVSAAGDTQEPRALRPPALGLAWGGHKPRHRAGTTGEQEGEPGLELADQHGAKPYSNNAVRHEDRRRRRQQHQQQRAPAGAESTDESGSEQGDDGEGLLAIARTQGAHGRLGVARRGGSRTTNNYLTINGWKGAPGERPDGSRLSTETPYILLVYLQLVFNSSLVLFALYLASSLVLMIRTDINHKVVVHATRLRQEIEACTKEYQSNRCFPVEQRTKFIEEHCATWEACMNRDPQLLSRSKIGAETFAEVMNGFVDAISWKTMLFIFLSIGAGVYATNLAMNSYKAKWDPHPRHPFAPALPSKSLGPRTFDGHDPMTIFGRDEQAGENRRAHWQ